MAPSRLDPEIQFESQFGVPNFETLPKRYGWPTENNRGYQIKEAPFGTERPLRVIHVGAGASGICLAKFLPSALKNVSLICYEKNNDIGGTWLENRYPGCACDIPSVNYQVRIENVRVGACKVVHTDIYQVHMGTKTRLVSFLLVFGGNLAVLPRPC
jgi:hypothetical protein